ncbi:NUDIX domain-containing protein [Nocardioides sp. NBC_00368]|uniref:NUDIX domain-containing protein n=1 Tax=Nocardioides sp. NBC_00368 TaxID=2976000 RepID=UPI002E20DA58
MSPEDRLLTDIAIMVDSIEPMDAVEIGHIAEASAWLCMTDDVFRRSTAPTAPAKHLVSYFLLVDPVSGHVLLGDHRKSGLWLPSGGHVEPGENPAETVRRECIEELGVEAAFIPPSARARSWSPSPTPDRTGPTCTPTSASGSSLLTTATSRCDPTSGSTPQRADGHRPRSAPPTQDRSTRTWAGCSTS